LNTDRVVSLSAMLVGLGSLFIIVYQTALLREQQAASSLPYVMVGIMANPDRTYIVARNTGVGAALIEEVVVRYRGSEIKKDPHDFFQEVRPKAVAAGLSAYRTYGSVYGDRWRVMSDTVVPQPL
jgi:hypothetical protein